MAKRYVVRGWFRLVVDAENLSEAKEKASRILRMEGIEHVVNDAKEAEEE